MSMWTHLQGVIEVRPMCRTDIESRYILETVLAHLPKVTGSERDMRINIVQPDFTAKSYSEHTYDEFGNWTNLGETCGRDYDKQYAYLIVVYGDFRDRVFEETFLEFEKWLERLAKRIYIGNDEMIVKLDGFDKDYIEKSYIFTNDNYKYSNMYEQEDNWCDYLVWGDGTIKFPDELCKKYHK